MPIDLGFKLAARWPRPDPAHLPLLKQAGVEYIVLNEPHADFEAAARAQGIQAAREPDAVGLVSRGRWPGVLRQPNRRGRGDETASASSEPWLDANGYLAAFERAIHPGRTPVLAYKADETSGLTAERSVPFESLALALIEARINGGNYLLSVEQRYREALLAGDARALEAWKQLARVASWLKENADLLGRPALPAITALVEPGESTSEIANLLFRRNAGPRLASAANPPAPSPGIRTLAAAGLKQPPPAIRERILAHARRGATVVMDAQPDPSWKLLRKEPDRSFYPIGRGQVAAYHKRVADPSEFALDVIDIVTYRRRPCRLWNALAAIPLATEGRAPGEAVLAVINYGRALEDEVQARIGGHFTQARILRPEAGPSDLKVARRGNASEVFLPGLGQVAVVVFR